MSHRLAGGGGGVGDGSGTRCMSKRQKNANLKTSFTSKKKLLEEQLQSDLFISRHACSEWGSDLPIWTLPSQSAAISQRGCGSHPGAALIDPSTPRRRLVASQSQVYFHGGGVAELQRNRQAYRGPR